MEKDAQAVAGGLQNTQSSLTEVLAGPSVGGGQAAVKMRLQAGLSGAESALLFG